MGKWNNLVFGLCAIVVILIVLWIANLVFGLGLQLNQMWQILNDITNWFVTNVQDLFTRLGNAMGGTDLGTGSSGVNLATGITNFCYQVFVKGPMDFFGGIFSRLPWLNGG